MFPIRQSPLFPISSDYRADDDVCSELLKLERQRLSCSAAHSDLVFFAVGPALCLSSVASTTLRPPSRDPRMTISCGPCTRFPACGGDFVFLSLSEFGKTSRSPSLRRINFHRLSASCERSSDSRGTLKRSGVIGCLCRSRSSFVSIPS